MNKFYFTTLVLVSLFLWSNTSSLWAAGPEKKVKDTTNYILSVVTEPALKDSDKAEERKRLLRIFIRSACRDIRSPEAAPVTL